MKVFIYSTILLLLYSLSSQAFNQKVYSESTFYTVSSTTKNVLYKNNSLTNTWTMVGETGTTELKALAYINETGTLYGIDEGVLGTINTQTGSFTAFGSVNSGEGAYGEVILNNIEALTYDPFSKLLFAIHSIPGEGENTNDVFFKIDPETGLIVKGAVFDFKDRRFDYLPISEILRESASVKDIVGFTINPINYDLVALHTQDGYSIITKLNKRTGEIERVLHNSISPFSDIAFDESGNLYATIGDNPNGQADTFVLINLDNGIESTISNIANGINPSLNVQSLTSTGIEMLILDNDLALRIELSPDQQNPVTQGSVVSFDIIIFNQGELEVDEVRLSAEIDKDKLEVLDLGLDQSKWIRIGNRIYGSFESAIKPGENFTVSFEAKLNDNFMGMMSFSSEIFYAYNHNITNEIGKYKPLQDIDAYYDNLNNEINVVNNEINGGGFMVNEDEDDHDIVTLEVVEPIPPPYNKLTKFNCYAVSEDNDAPNVLFEFNPSTLEWTEVGITGGTNIEAIATDPVTGIIYATDAGTFGIIDAHTALFSPIGEVGTGNGEAGLIDLNDIDGLTYDPVNQIMYGTHRVGGFGPGTNDLLFQIDVATGQFIPGAMIDYKTGNPVDYAIIPEVFDSSFKRGKKFDLYDVDDIAYNSYTGQLFAIQNQDGPGILTELYPISGEVAAIIYDVPDDDMEGLGFTYLGELYGTTGNNGSTQRNSNTFIHIDLRAGSTTTLSFIDPTGREVDFEAFDCFTAYNDLALLLETESDQLVNTGSEITFLLTIFNQGDFPNNNISITNYIPKGLTLADSNWMDSGDGKAIYTFDGILQPGEDHTITITYTVEPGYEGQTLTNTAEISSSFLPDIIDVLSLYDYPTDFRGNPTALPDFDSQPDNENNETNVADNEILGGGLNSIINKDEDDHDIAIIEVAETYNELTKFHCYTVSSEENAPNVLFEYNPEIDEWIEVGVTGGISIEAIATDPVTGIIYATDEGTFGTIDAQTALFNPIGEIGFGNGVKGLIELNDVDGLTYDPINQIMYGTHRVEGTDPGTNDLLFQIDVATGKVIPKAMLNPADSRPVDYAIIPEVFDSEFAGDMYDVNDIAYNTYTGQLFALQGQSEYRTYTITELNPLTGEVEAVIYDVRPEIQGIGFSNFGGLFGTTGDDDYYVEVRNSLFFIDLAAGSAPKLNFIDPSNQHKDFEAFDCFTAFNDLALLLETESQLLVNTGSAVTFLLTIFNQGNFPNTNITLTNYIPNGLTLADSNWMASGDGKTTYTFEGILQPGEDHTITITYTTEQGFEGQTLTNAAEISSSSYSPGIIDVLSPDYQTGLLGNQIAFPDFDSKPDSENNETNVVDNELNGGGPNSIFFKDEDDHDIAIIQVGPLPCPAYLVIPDEEISGYHQAQQEINIQGYVKKSKTAVFDICE